MISDFDSIVEKTRSYRRFDENIKLTDEQLRSLVELARKTASAANRQPLHYIIVNDVALNKTVFSTLKWAGYLSDWNGPAEGERPAAYIIVLAQRDLAGASTQIDEGIAAQTILLGATVMNFGGCILGAVNRSALYTELKIDEAIYEIPLVIALGKPSEKVILESVVDDNIKYYRDCEQVHHVPKRSLDEVILTIKK